jgi:hypothetical protein
MITFFMQIRQKLIIIIVNNALLMSNFLATTEKYLLNAFAVI